MKYLAFLLLLMFPAARDRHAPVTAPSGLMVEFIREPAGVSILDLNPEFTWIVPAGAVKQLSYQVLIASSSKSLAGDTGDIWDSKKVTSSLSSEVECGVSLSPGMSYSWKVRIWDSKGKVSPYSEPQSFKTGTAVNYLTTRNRFIVTENIPVGISKLAGNVFMADFGKDAFGSLSIDVDSPSADTIVLHIGEKLNSSGTIERNPGGSIRYAKYNLAVSSGKHTYMLNLPKDTRNTTGAAVLLPDSLGVVTPFRYCEVENYPSALTVNDIRRKMLNYYFDDRTSSFSSSDTVLNQVWDICKYSIKATSFAGLYVDGDRERIPYEADAYINQLGHYYTDREYSLARLSNEYFIKNPTWPTEWILHTVPMFYFDFMFTGNTESAAFFYNELKAKNLTALEGPDGLISVKRCTAEIMESIGFKNKKERLRDIVDWPPSQKDTGWKLVNPAGERDDYEMVEVNTVVNAFYYRSLVMMAELAGYLGKADDKAYFSGKASQVKKVFNEKLFDKSRGIYTDGEGSLHSSLHANMTALAFGLVPVSENDRVISFIKSRGMACSVYGAQYLLEGLYRAGAADYALDLMTAVSDRSWWNMIRSGSTITLEAWDMKYKPNSDWNHAWGAVPANIIPGFMWGISPALPGYAKAAIKPQLAGLKKSSVSVPTIRGNIFAEYTDNGKSKIYEITIPANMDCDFIISGMHSATFNNKKINTGSGIIRLEPGLNRITY